MPNQLFFDLRVYVNPYLDLVLGRRCQHLGRTYGLGLTSFIALLFEGNEQSANGVFQSSPEKFRSAYPVTDNQLIHNIRREYPDHKLTQDPDFTLHTYRRKYNSGDLIEHYLPKHPSFAYNADRQRITPRGRVYTGQEVLAILNAHTARYHQWTQSR